MAIKNQQSLPKGRRYSPEEKEQAVRLVRTLRDELGTSHGTVQRVAEQLGYGVESVRSWVKQADVDDGLVGGTTTSMTVSSAGPRRRTRSGSPSSSRRTVSSGERTRS